MGYLQNNLQANRLASPLVSPLANPLVGLHVCHQCSRLSSRLDSLPSNLPKSPQGNLLVDHPDSQVVSRHRSQQGIRPTSRQVCHLLVRLQHHPRFHLVSRLPNRVPSRLLNLVVNRLRFHQ